MAASKSVYDPSEHQHIVGMTFVKQENRPILVVGKVQFSKLALGYIGSPHIAAATNLQRVIVERDIRSMEQLASEATEIGNYKGLGVTAYSTLLAVLESQGFDIETVHGEKKSFQSVKKQWIKKEGTNGNGHKPRKRSRRRR